MIKKSLKFILAGIFMIAASLFGQSLVQPTPTNRLSNASARVPIGTGDNIGIGGFVLKGTGSKWVLMRGVGPLLGLTPFNIPGSLQDTQLSVFQGNTRIIYNSHWNNDPKIQDVASQVGAFPLPLFSDDSASLAELTTNGSNNAFTCQLAGANGKTGIGMVEIYDASGNFEAPWIINMSMRAVGGTGNDVLIGGFVIDGTGTKNVLIRGVGPTLASMGLSAATLNLDPRIVVLNNKAQVIASNDDWWTGGLGINGEPLAQTMSRLGAFPLPSDSKDSALALQLGAGSYTVHVQAVTGPGGVALVEIYDGN